MKNAEAKPIDATGYFLSAINVARSAGNELLVAAAALGLGSASTIQGDYAQAKLLHIEARKLFRLDMRNSKASRTQHGDWERSIACGRSILKQKHRTRKLGRSTTKKGINLGLRKPNWIWGTDIYRLGDKFPRAEASYHKSREICTKNEDYLGVARAEWALGEVYRREDRYFKAEASYVEGMDIYTQFYDQSGIANAAWGLGEIYRLWGEPSMAEASYTKARNIYTQIKDQRGVADAAWGLGEVYRLQDEYNKAEESYTEAREPSAWIGYQWGVESVVSSVLKLEDQRERHNSQVPA